MMRAIKVDDDAEKNCFPPWKQWWARQGLNL